ncbi:MAG TPA: ABC transporter permease, partial [Thermoanaerobaculia bacterium]|nr:ABC transporter permease [Thermoanaerobaculia bacterium]
LEPDPAVGRTITGREAATPGARVVMLSHAFWRRQFGGDASLPGKTIVLDRQTVLVAGVLPRGFRGTDPLSVPDVWLPVATWISLTGDRGRLSARGHRDLDLFGRLRPGATLAQARAELAGISGALERTFPETNGGRRMTVVPEHETRGAPVARLSSILLAVAGLVLLIACANVASLLLARAEGRRHELATRAALGATRPRLLRQLAVETALLAAAGAGAALLVGSSLIGFLPGVLAGLNLGAGLDAHMSLRVLVFAGAAAAGSLLLFGILPAWRISGMAPASMLGQRAASARDRGGIRSGLVVGQVAIGLALSVTAILLVRSFVRAQRADPGFDAHQEMLVLELVPGFGPQTAEGQRRFVEEARRRIEALPGVAGTAAGMRIPFGLSGGAATRRVFFPGAGSGDAPTVGFDPVGDRFFELIGTPVLRGRAIDARDLRGDAPVVVVNETMARRFWPRGDALGSVLRLGRPDGRDHRVVGIVRNSVNAELGEDPSPYLYVPMGDDDYGELALVVKTRGEASSVAGPVRRALRALDPAVPVVYLATLRDHMKLATASQRVTGALVVSLGSMGLLLAAVGLYGLMSFVVSLRVREFGIRVALGASPRSIFEGVLVRALVLTGAGIAAGSVVSFGAAKAVGSILFGIGPGDPVSFALGMLLLAATGASAALLPALRATRIDPAEVLRCE